MNHFWRRIVNIISRPGKTWVEIKNEKLPAKKLFITYALTTATVPAAAQFIKMSVIGKALFGLHFRVPIAFGLVHASLYYILSLVGVLALASLVYVLAPSFNSRKDFDLAANLAVFSIIPAWLGEIFILVPYVGFIWVFIALYGLVLLCLGLPVLMETPADQLVMYFTVVMISGFVIVLLVSMIPSLFFPGFPVL